MNELATARLYNDYQYFVIYMEDTGIHQRVVLLRLMPAGMAGNNQFEQMAAQEPGTGTSKEQVVTSLFKQLPVTNKQQIMLLTWGHGSVYSIFKAQPSASVPFNFLSADEISNCFANGLGCKVELLVMMNCWMQNIHTCAALKDSVNFLVAAQGMIMEFIYDYAGLLHALPGADAPALCQNIKNNLRPEFSYTMKEGDALLVSNELETLSLFFTSLHAYNIVLQETENFITLLLTHLEEKNAAFIVRKLIKDARACIYTFDIPYQKNAAPYYMVDIISFAESLAQLDAGNFLLPFNRLSAAIRQAYVIPPYIGQRPYESYYPQAASRNFEKPPFGTGIYFPATKEQHFNSFLTKFTSSGNTVSFYRNSKWLEFLEKYYSL